MRKYINAFSYPIIFVFVAYVFGWYFFSKSINEMATMVNWYKFWPFFFFGVFLGLLNTFRVYRSSN